MPGRSSANLNGTTIGLLRSKSGCKTCKIRRVKCGEEKPHCVRCTSTGRKCDYDDRKSSKFSIVPSTQPILANSLSISPNTMWRERRAFAYYFQNAASAVGGGLDVDFWRTIVPQVCRSEPAVWDAIISVSALFESPEPISDPDRIQNHRDALGWYSRSVSAVRQQIERGSVDTFVGLISCVLFICIEALQGGVDEAIQLYCQGVHLILALRTQIASGLVPAAKAALLEDTIVPIFIRLGLIGFTFSRPQIGLLLRGMKRRPTHIFVSLRAAREEITRLGAEIQFFQHACGEHLLSLDEPRIPQDLLDLQADLSVQLRDWDTAFVNLVESLRTTSLPSEDVGTISLLSAIYETLFIMLEVSASSSEVITDAFLPNFQRIVEQCRISLDASLRADGTQPPFTFDINPGVALWFTCLRCRDPIIRREALALLLRSPRVQGFYSCMSAVTFGERIMLLEEMNGEVMSTNPETTHFSTTESLVGYQYSPRSSSSLSPESTGSDAGTPLIHPIPEEARIGHFDVFQPERGLPPDITEEVMARWNLRPDRTFLGFWRNERDEGSDTWRMVREYIPMDLKY
ncbi:C6 zinc finger domain protein [Penicillium brasilianum]|uniref:C6 zinc finger domain protein n=1 Tax=Penicillium brasilianum TaxID=104259 RepID=A0A1S9S0L4_PENBI|nr:C6 zinc finger domain protein [Penicillium brasilianum]